MRDPSAQLFTPTKCVDTGIGAGFAVAVAVGGMAVRVDVAVPVGATITCVGVALAAAADVFVAVAFGAAVGVSVAEITIGVDFLPLPWLGFGVRVAVLPPDASSGAACVARANITIATDATTNVTAAAKCFRENRLRSLNLRANTITPHYSPEGQDRQRA